MVCSLKNTAHKIPTRMPAMEAVRGAQGKVLGLFKSKVIRDIFKGFGIYFRQTGRVR